MDIDEQIKPKRSLGTLRKTAKTKPRSPDLTGTIKLQRHTFEVIARQFQETDGDEILANLAAWTNHDAEGPYLSTEISPKYVKREQPAPKRSNLLDFLMNDHDGEQE